MTIKAKKQNKLLSIKKMQLKKNSKEPMVPFSKLQKCFLALISNFYQLLIILIYQHTELRDPVYRKFERVAFQRSSVKPDISCSGHCAHKIRFFFSGSKRLLEF